MAAELKQWLRSRKQKNGHRSRSPTLLTSPQAVLLSQTHLQALAFILKIPSESKKVYAFNEAEKVTIALILEI